MKKVFSSHSEVCHVFANQLQDEGRAGNIFFEKSYGFTFDYANKIYSYGRHYLLAEFIYSSSGKEAILINNSGYSVSTSKHINIIEGATRQYQQFFTMYCDIDLIYKAYKNLLDKLSRAKKPEIYINEINSLYLKLKEYHIYMEIDTNELSIEDGTKYEFIVETYNNVNGQFSDYLSKLQEVAKQEAAKKKRQEAQKRNEQLEKFYTYEISRCFGIGNEDFLRVSQDRTKVETSQGVKVSIESAKILYKMILAKRDIAGHMIDNYRVTSINGVLTIGCHKINIDSMHKVGSSII